MLKHPACAAAINSSGFVPGLFSNRVVNEYGVPFNTPLAVETVPLPCLRSPCQTADAVLFITRALSYRPIHSAIPVFNLCPSQIFGDYKITIAERFETDKDWKSKEQ